MKYQEIDWTKPQRQSPAALLILVYKVLISLLKFLWPLLILIIIRNKSNTIDRYEIIGLAISVLSVVVPIIEYYYFRFSVINGELIIKKGLFIKKVITLPLSKIQAIHSEQSWLHNLLNVSQLSFDSAGSEKLEAKIEALDKFRTAALKEYIHGQRADMSTENPESNKQPEELLISLSGKDLFKLCVSANHMEAFFIMLAFTFSVSQSIGISDNEYSGVLKGLLSFVQSGTFSLLLFLAIAALIVSVGFSFIRVILTYTEFNITRSEKGFRIKTGLINKKEKFVPFRKIQFISWKANWIKQYFGMYLLQYHATGSDHLQNKMQVKVPVTRNLFIPLLLENYHPLLQVKEINPLKIHKSYINRRVLLLGIIPALLASPLLFYFYREYVFFIVIWIGIIWILSLLIQKKFRLWPSKEALQIEKGIFGSHKLILNWEKIQSVQLIQNLYQQKHQLATVKLFTAGGIIRLPYFSLTDARLIQNYALYKIENSDIPWS